MTYKDLGSCTGSKVHWRYHRLRRISALQAPVSGGGWLYGPGTTPKYNNNILLALVNQLAGTYVPTLTGAV